MDTDPDTSDTGLRVVPEPARAGLDRLTILGAAVDLIDELASGG